MKNLACLALLCFSYSCFGQNHPEIYISNLQKATFEERMKKSDKVQRFVEHTKNQIDPYVNRHVKDPDWIISRLQMYWNRKFQRVYVNGMDFSHGEGEALVPTVKFSGSRDWATDYLKPAIEDIKPYLDDERGMYLQNDIKAGKPWEWVKEAETGHIIENINRDILKLAEEAAFIYWINKEEKYAIFASDILMTYLIGMHHREAPRTVGDHKNEFLMGLQTFEVIHEGIIEPITVCYDFLFDYLIKEGKDVKMAQSVFQKWADQEIKYGVPGNNWNMMQARFITYLAIALEDDSHYSNGKGQQYYLDQVLNQNSIRQKSLKDVMKNFDPETAIWPEVAGYSIMVSDDLLEIVSLMDKALNNQLLDQFPILEKAILANFNYLAPNGFTVAYGDAKHARLRYNAFELLVAQYRKYERKEKEMLITNQLHGFMEDGSYVRNEIKSLFELFFYVDELEENDEKVTMVNPTFYSPNVSWIVQRNGNSPENGMMISSNASLGNHSHTNGINMELFAKGMAIAPDAAAGQSYWTKDHTEYYSRFPAHNTVVVDGISDYRNMRGTQSFELKKIYPDTDQRELVGDFTFSEVEFLEPSTKANQQRVLGTVRTGGNSGYFIDIFRSARNDGKDKKHEYIFHSQGEPVNLFDYANNLLTLTKTEELSSEKGDQAGYNYFTEKRGIKDSESFRAQFEMPSLSGEMIKLNLWMKGDQNRELFTALSPYSRAIHPESVVKELYHKASPTLIVRQNGPADKRPFVAIIDAVTDENQMRVESVSYFNSKVKNPDFVGIKVESSDLRKTKTRMDLIYNATNAAKTHFLEDGFFKGSYAIISETEQEPTSFFLGNGEKLSYQNWEIEANKEHSSILIEAKEGSYFINANHAFSFRIPLQKNESKYHLKAGDGTIYRGELIEKNGSAVLLFKLPQLFKAVLLKE